MLIVWTMKELKTQQTISLQLAKEVRSAKERWKDDMEAKY